MTEIIVTVAILGAAAFVTRVVVDVLTSVQREGTTANINLAIQSVMYEIVRTTRNADSIEEANQTKLELLVFDTKNFGYNDPGLFLPANKGTVTYEYKPAVGNTPSHIERKVNLPSNGFETTHKLLTDQLVAPDPTNPMFDGEPTTTPPYEYVEILLRLDPKFLDRGRLKQGGYKPKEYHALTMKRTQTRFN